MILSVIDLMTLDVRWGASKCMRCSLFLRFLCYLGAEHAISP